MLWAAVLGLWAAGVLRAVPSVVYLLTIATVAVYVASAAQTTSNLHDGWRSARQAVVLGLLVAVPAVFDPSTVDGFNLPKYGVVLVSAFALAGLWAIGAVRHRRLPRWRNGLHWPVLALVAWTAVTSATSVNPRFSALGAYGSYDGLYAAVGFAVVFFAAAEAFSLKDLKTVLAVLYFGAGSLVVLLGLVQLHDRHFGGRDWDWIHRGEITSTVTGVWASLGNPNHLGAFLAIIFPVGLVLVLLYRSPWVRVLVAVMSLAILVEMVETASRGAWLATVMAGAALAVLLADEARCRPGLFLAGAAAAAVVVLAAGLVLASSGERLRTKLDSAVSLSGSNTITQRFELWRAAVDMANDHPVLGVGPDAFRAKFFAYQSPKFVELYGTDQVANGAHNVFFNQLAAQGYPGLAILVCLLGLAAALAGATWRRLRWHERNRTARSRRRDDGDAEVRRRAREGRLALTAIVSALVAYVVQASFNVQQIALSFMFWALLGLLCVAALAVGAVPSDLWRRRGGAAEEEAVGTSALAWGNDEGPVHKRRRGARRPPPLSPIDRAFVYGMAALVAVGLLTVATLAAGPWRADHAFATALREQQRLAGGDLAPEEFDRIARRASTALRTAQNLNPWEPQYLAIEARTAAQQADRERAGSPRQREHLERAQSLYRRAHRLAPGNARLLVLYAEVLLRLHQLDPAKRSLSEDAVAALRQAQRENPYERVAERILRALGS